MSIPDFQSIMLPLLKVAVKGESSIRDSGEVLAREFGLSDFEVQEMLPSRADVTFRNRVRWAKTYLGKAGLIEPTKRGHFRITDRGKKVLKESPLDWIGCTYRQNATDTITQLASPMFEASQVVCRG